MIRCMQMETVYHRIKTPHTMLYGVPFTHEILCQHYKMCPNGTGNRQKLCSSLSPHMHRHTSKPFPLHCHKCFSSSQIFRLISQKFAVRTRAACRIALGCIHFSNKVSGGFICFVWRKAFFVVRFGSHWSIHCHHIIWNVDSVDVSM